MKVLISATVVRDEHIAGRTEITAVPGSVIITPEARTVAAQLGIKFVDPAQSNASPPLSIAAESSRDKAGDDSQDTLYEAVRAQVIERLPSGKKMPENVIRQLIEKVMKEGRPSAGHEQAGGHRASAPGKVPNYNCQKMAGGIKRVDGSSVNFGRLVGVSQGESIGVADVITAQDSSPMCAGYMSWSDCFFPWTPDNDEINVVLEGVLHLRSGGSELICNAGDVVFIPRGSSLELGTPTHTRFLYVTYPANNQGA